MNKNVIATVVFSLAACAGAEEVTWNGHSVNTNNAYYGNSASINGSGNLEVGVGALNGFGFTLNGVAGHVYQGRTDILVNDDVTSIEASFKMPESNAVGAPIDGKNAYDSWLSVRVLRYPASVEHSGDAGFFFTSSNGNLGDMYYANTRIVGDPASNDNPEFGQLRAGSFAPGTEHSLKIARTSTGQLEYSLDGTLFHTSALTSASFPELNDVQLGGGIFVAGSNGDGTDVPSTAFEFTGFTTVPEPASLGLLALGGVLLGRRRRV